jgi:hypothetical protein
MQGDAMISTDDYLWFVDQALDAMLAVIGELGEQLACERPELAGANSAYGIVTHCLGVMNSWAGHLVAGREVVRDREAEFVASGSIEDLVSKVGEARLQFREDVAIANADAPLLFAPRSPEDSELPYGKRQGAALLHVYEELSQHLGQMEISRDLLLARS